MSPGGFTSVAAGCGGLVDGVLDVWLDRVVVGDVAGADDEGPEPEHPAMTAVAVAAGASTRASACTYVFIGFSTASRQADER